MSSSENSGNNSAGPIDFYDLAAKFAEETSSSDQPHRLLKIWAHRFPEHAADLAAIAYASIIEPTGQPGEASNLEREEVIESARRVLSRFNRVAAPLESIINCAKLAGLTAKTLADQLKLDIVLLAKLEQRLLDVKSIPPVLIDKLAALISRTSTDVATYLSSPPRLALGASYRSKQAPTVGEADKQTFIEALSSDRSISPDDKAYWLAEVTKSGSVQ